MIQQKTIYEDYPQKPVTRRNVHLIADEDNQSASEITPEDFEQKKQVFRFYQIIWYILDIIEVFLGFRLILEIIGANSASGFTNFIYTISYPLALPFMGIVPTAKSGSSIFEWSTLIAMLVYVVIASGIIKLIKFLNPVTPDQVKRKVDLSN